jgi:DNA-binding NarL/FixJ family response regulator
MNKIRVIIVDDHPFIIEGIKISLMGVDDIEIVGEAADSGELFSILSEPYPDVLLLDITLPGISGIEVARMITEKQNGIKVMMISANTDEESIVASLAAGARGYLTKNTGTDELVKGIRAVYDGEDFLGETISKEILIQYLRKAKSGEMASKGNHSGLTDREKSIVGLIAEGLTYKEIGDRLCISARTVETHRNNIMQKLELATTADLIKYSIRAGITSL